MATGLLALIGGIGGGFLSSREDGPGSKDTIDAQFFRDQGLGGSTASLLGAQGAFGVGASADAIADDFIFQQLVDSGSASLARHAKQQLNLARAQASSGNLSDARFNIERLNTQIGNFFGSRSVAAPGRFTISGDGKITAEVDDPSINETLQLIRGIEAEGGSGILQSRLKALQSIASLTGELPGSLSEFQRLGRNQVSDEFDTRRQEILQQANIGGFNPANQLAELDKGFELQAINRASALLGLSSQAIQGTQAALDPTSTLAVAQAIGNVAPASSASISNAQAQAAIRQQSDANLAAGISGGIGGFNSALFTNKFLELQNQPGTNRRDGDR